MVQSNLSRKIGAASDWVETVDILLKELKLPDPAKRGGLKKIASDFVRCDQRINACYDAYNRPPNKDFMVLTAILNLWAKLGLDAVIRDRLINGAAVTEGEEDHYEGDELRLKIPPALQSMDSVRMLASVSKAMRQKEADEDMLYHGLDIMRTMAFNHRSAMLATSSQLPLVAALASPNIQIRLIGFIALLRLGTSITEMEGRSINSLHIWGVGSNMEKHFTPRLMGAIRRQYGGLYGGMITEIRESGLGIAPLGLNLGVSGDCLYIGRELCKKILEKEHSLGAAAICEMGAEGLFARAAHALQSSPNPADAHLPAILDIKLAIAVGDRERICSLSDRAIQQFPEVGFFYYARAIWTEESRLALRLSKKGSAEAGYEMTVNGVLDHARLGSSVWREGLAILHCTRGDAKAYIEMTPMDQKSMKAVLYTYLATTLILEGDQVFEDIGRIKPYVEQLRIAEDIFEVVIGPVPRTQRKVAIDTIEPLFMTKIKEWRQVIGRLDKPRKGHIHGTESSGIHEWNPDRTFANWLARTELEDEDAPQSDYAELGYSEGLCGTRADGVVMYRCSLCGNPSASLKRCARCKSARYCDEDCQKKHWKKSHKLTCKPPTAAT
ncbi:unnamed protein product [Rhizoctonia solani]|uniref:MYND-type domain-containing protein n=1 Tax=Rhizoctonia solani TaxID=456999 RepID=A0A8H3C1S8_9AGAM|nr:unnamed protein product [Rhizoctonia solani]